MFKYKFSIVTLLRILKLKPGAVAIKKKIKRIREAKHNETISLTDYPETLSQTNATEEPNTNENGKGNEQ